MYSEHDVLVIIMIPWKKWHTCLTITSHAAFMRVAEETTTKLTEYTSCWQSAAGSAHNSIVALDALLSFPRRQRSQGLSNTSGKYSVGLKVLAVSSQEILEHGARPSSLPPPDAVADSSWNPSGILGKNARGLVCTASPGKPTPLSCLQHWASSRNIPASNKRQGSLIVCWAVWFP